MTPKKPGKHYVRPMRVFVGHGTRAERRIRQRILMPEPTALAPGLPPTPEHDLVFNGGKIITDLVFTNFYVGGSSAWDAADISSIDQALGDAMSDQDLNNVMSQYYPSGKITSKFTGSQTLAGPPPQTVSQGDVENLLKTLFQAGTLKNFDFTSTAFNFMLPSGTVLNTDAAPTTSAISPKLEAPGKVETRPAGNRAAAENEEDSLHGLGGYHGSVHVGSGPDEAILYYAIGVYSEQLSDGTTNGIPVFDQSWKNVVATFYHELNEVRTDPDVEDAIRAGNDPNAINFIGWTSPQGEECGDFPVFEANPLSEVFQEVELTGSTNTVPVQFQYSDADHGPGTPRDTPAPFAGGGSGLERVV
ncbi:MAG TPA: hypothetical protein VFP59_04340 [Candidatus Angelobacter sp.]|nr:hypothetical protein [Candidatus Angelobacter sp.]